MNKLIQIDLSNEGLKQLQSGLNEYKKWLERKTEELCKLLAARGEEKAGAGFEMSLYDGIKDAAVSVEKRGKSEYAVAANGKSVLFIEFGTGVHYPNAPLDGYIGAGGMVHGSFGKGLGNNDYWFYTGQPGNAGGELAHGHSNSTITHGNPPNMPMYNAVKYIEQNFVGAAKEVFEE